MLLIYQPYINIIYLIIKLDLFKYQFHNYTVLNHKRKKKNIYYIKINNLQHQQLTTTKNQVETLCMKLNKLVMCPISIHCIPKTKHKKIINR